MPHYLIDGNNLLGKLSSRDKSYRAENPLSRELLLMKVISYFQNRKDEVTLFFDGYESDKLRAGKIKIVYSNNRPADKLIRERIEQAKSRSNLVVVSSDNEIRNYARVCSCSVIKSEEFSVNLFERKAPEKEHYNDEKTTSEDKEFFLKLFSQGK
ncbi:MAG: NYN domain-containing protein [Ignavibacteriaceae bacterium]|nr:NYN domain-containing protein [Ignavibacteriaceae bacterium]